MTSPAAEGVGGTPAATERPGRWPPRRRFWVAHLWAPMFLAALLLTAVAAGGIDLWLADRWFALEGGAWAWRDHWLAYDVIHHHGKQMVIGFGLLVILGFAGSFFSSRLRPWRWPLAYLVTSMILLPSVIASAKRFSPVSCPWDLQRYGGDVPYLHSVGFDFGVAAGGHCFPAGHASGGFALIALYFAVYLYARRPALFLLPGLLVGWTFALGQQSRGAHFLSHDLWTLSWCWFGALGLFLLFRPGRWQPPEAQRPTPS